MWGINFGGFITEMDNLINECPLACYTLSMHKRNAFTLVEILITIVIIAILASISMVAYSGIQTRAQAASTLATESNYAKVIQIYQSTQGDYPVTTDNGGMPLPFASSSGFICAGDPSDYPAKDGFLAGSCATTDGGVTSSMNASSSFHSQLTSVSGTIRVNSNNVVVAGSNRFRGVNYAAYPSSVGSGSVRLQYYVNGDVSCGSGAKDYYAPPTNITYCLFYLRH